MMMVGLSERHTSDGTSSLIERLEDDRIVSLHQQAHDNTPLSILHSLTDIHSEDKKHPAMNHSRDYEPVCEHHEEQLDHHSILLEEDLD